MKTCKDSLCIAELATWWQPGAGGNLVPGNFYALLNLQPGGNLVPGNFHWVLTAVRPWRSGQVYEPIDSCLFAETRFKFAAK